MDQTAYFEQMRRKRRTEILNAARNMVLSQGIAVFNIQQLARELDISTVTLYKYFKNSNDIMLALKEQILQDTLNRILPGGQPDTQENPLEAFLHLLRSFYAETLKHQDDIALLLLFEMHAHSLPSSEAQGSPLNPYLDRLTTDMELLLTNAKAEGYVKADLDISEALQFITGMNLAMLQHIGLISEDNYKKEENRLKQQIEQLISLFKLYLTVS